MRPWPLLFLVGCPAPEAPDTDTDGVVDTDTGPACDLDGDGHDGGDCGGDDCDDADPERFPGAPERCNGVDDDCDGQARWEDAPTCQACADMGWLGPLAREDVGVRDRIRGDLSGVRCRYAEASRRLFLVLDEEDGEVEGVYTGRRVTLDGDKPDPTIMNVEHTWPRSLGTDRDPERCDLHHLFPTDSDANTARGNLPLGRVAGSPTWSEGGSRSDGVVFEPRDVHKGDAARALLYMELAYDGLALPDEQRRTLLDWHRDDAPTDREVLRSRRIASWQGATNPFVVCPFADEILRP